MNVVWFVSRVQFYTKLYVSTLYVTEMLKWTNGFVLVLIQVELIQIECSKHIRSIFTKKMTRTFFSGRNKLFPPQQKNCLFPARTKNWHNSTTRQTDNCNFVFSGRNKTFPPQQKNCQFPARTKNWHNSTTGKKVPPAHAKRGQVPPAHAKRVYLFLCLSVHPSVCL